MNIHKRTEVNRLEPFGSVQTPKEQRAENNLEILNTGENLHLHQVVPIVNDKPCSSSTLRIQRTNLKEIFQLTSQARFFGSIPLPRSSLLEDNLLGVGVFGNQVALPNKKPVIENKTPAKTFRITSRTNSGAGNAFLQVVNEEITCINRNVSNGCTMNPNPKSIANEKGQDSKRLGTTLNHFNRNNLPQIKTPTNLTPVTNELKRPIEKVLPFALERRSPVPKSNLIPCSPSRTDALSSARAFEKLLKPELPGRQLKISKTAATSMINGIESPVVSTPVSNSTYLFPNIS